MSAPRYAPLWCKSNFSFLEGASHPEELVDAAAACGLPAVALTDRDGVYGIVKAYDRARARGIRLITGSHVSLADGTTVVLLARDRAGYRNLCGLLSAGRLRCEKGRSIVSPAELCARAEGLVALWLHPELGRPLDGTIPAPSLRPALPGVGASARGEGGTLPRRGGRGAAPDDDAPADGAAAPQPASLHASIAPLRAAFGDRLFAVVARHRWVDDGRIEREVREAAAAANIPLVAATEVLYHDRARKPLQDVVTCIRHTVTLEEAGTRLTPNAEHALLPAAEFASLYADDPALVARTLEIAQACTFSLSEVEYRYPDEAVPPGFTTAQWLRTLTYDGARQRYGDHLPVDVAGQIERELQVIEELRYPGYFLTMWEIVQFCRTNGILCQGRGSAANSAVCFCLGVTAIDPVRMELLFERFLSRERAEPPDIDLDIEHNRREEVIQHMYAKYGRDRAAMVANVVRYRARSAVREVGKVLGVPQASLDRCAKLMPHWEASGENVFTEAGLDLALPVNRRLYELTCELAGFPRHLSIHPGGFLLGSEPIDHLVPIENATMEGRTVIQWDKYDVETLNLFKVDLLGLGALTHLDYCFALLRDHYGVDLTLATIPPDDGATFAMIGRADTVGVFQIESRAQMAMLPRLLPQRYYDLVVEVSIIRPGPITGGMVHPYLRRRRGEEEVVYPHPSLEPVLRKTLGVPLFQEQVMKLAVIAANYTAGEADQLRRDMAAWRISGQLDRHREKLVSRMIANGIPQEFAERVFEQIRGFGEYGFPESHAASFALIAYATAWLKCHYPAAFTCALLNAWPMGFYHPATIIEDAKRHGIRILPVDVLASDWDCTLAPDARPARDASSAAHPARPAAPAAERAVPAAEGDLAIRIGLRFVKELGENDWEEIRRARGSHPSSLAQFVAASRLPRDALERLAESDAFGCFGVHRRQALWDALGLHADAGATDGARRARPGRAEREPGATDGPAADDLGGARRARPERGAAALSSIAEERAVRFAALPASEAILWDYDSAEHSARGHLVEPYRSRFESEGLPNAAQVAGREDGGMVSYVGYVICRQMPGTARGVFFMTFEDESGFVNVIVWPNVFYRYRTLILTTSFLGVTGKLQAAEGVVHVIAESFWKPRLAPGEVEGALPSRDFH